MFLSGNCKGIVPTDTLQWDCWWTIKASWNILSTAVYLKKKKKLYWLDECEPSMTKSKTLYASQGKPLPALKNPAVVFGNALNWIWSEVSCFSFTHIISTDVFFFSCVLQRSIHNRKQTEVFTEPLPVRRYRANCIRVVSSDRADGCSPLPAADRMELGKRLLGFQARQRGRVEQWYS